MSLHCSRFQNKHENFEKSYILLQSPNKRVFVLEAAATACSNLTLLLHPYTEAIWLHRRATCLYSLMNELDGKNSDFLQGRSLMAITNRSLEQCQVDKTIPRRVQQQAYYVLLYCYKK